MIMLFPNYRSVLQNYSEHLKKNLKIAKFFKFHIFMFGQLNMNIKELYDACVDNDIKFSSYNILKKWLYFDYMDKYFLVTNYSVATIVQIFVYKPYKLTLTNAIDKYIVFDIGMNKGFSSMWFAMFPSIQKVIGYEINSDLQKLISENKRINKKLFDKIEVYNFGLSEKNKKINIHYLKNDDGVTTINKEFYERYWSKKRKEKVREKMVYVKKASDEIEKRMKEYPRNHYILKIDVEGAEYEILRDLYKNKLLKKFDIIMGETHLGFEKLEKYFVNCEIKKFEEFPNNLNTFIAYKKYER